MIRVLINGANHIACDYIRKLQKQSGVKIVAVISEDTTAPGIRLAETASIATSNIYDHTLLLETDYIIFPSEDGTLLKKLKEGRSMASIIQELDKQIFNDIIYQQNLDLILNTIDDGLVVVNNKEKVTFMNDKASVITGIPRDEAVDKHINEIINHSGLPRVLQTRKKEINKEIILENGKKIITSRIPIINEDNHLTGAFAFFKHNDDVIKLAEDNTNLIEIKSTLAALINSSDEAISIVDENGIGLIINPAYTKLTGLTEKDIIGKPASADISQGKSMHLQVLKTRRAVRGVKMRLGPNNKEVTVNVEPIIVNGKLKGSVAVIHNISEVNQLEENLAIAKQIIRNLEATYTFADIIFKSEVMELVVEQAKIAAHSPVTVLLKGEFGTGKELFANAIHNEGPRKYNKFIRMNCSMYNEAEMKQELFGIEEVSPTGEVLAKQAGLFEEANGGTVFLDEIGALSTHLQGELLLFLQKQELVRINGKDKIDVDVRVITATSTNLEKAVMQKTFDEDLYYMLNRLSISLPSLYERMNDLPLLARHLLTEINQKYGRNVKGISSDALKELSLHDWPGNVRELENVIGRAVISMQLREELIKPHHLPKLSKVDESTMPTLPTESLPLQDVMDDYERAYIRQVYKQNRFNKTKTAKVLNISVRNLYYKIDKYNLDGEI